MMRRMMMELTTVKFNLHLITLLRHEVGGIVMLICSSTDNWQIEWRTSETDELQLDVWSLQHNRDCQEIDCVKWKHTTAAQWFCYHYHTDV